MRRRPAALMVAAVLAIVGVAAACSSSGSTDAGPVSVDALNASNCFFNAAAFTGVPSWNFMPGRSFIVQVR